MDNNFMNASQNFGTEPKKGGKAWLWIVIILIVLGGVWYFMKGNMPSTTEELDTTASSLDSEIDTSIDSILSDLQSDDVSATAETSDMSDLYNLSIQ